MADYQREAVSSVSISVSALLSLPRARRGADIRFVDLIGRDPLGGMIGYVMSPHLVIDHSAIAAFCRRHHIRRLSLFGSALRDDFTPESDVDVLVEFLPGHVPGFEFVTIERELSSLLQGRRVDLVTPKFLNSRIRDQVLREAEPLYVAA